MPVKSIGAKRTIGTVATRARYIDVGV